jgi:hypothetical protein
MIWIQIWISCKQVLITVREMLAGNIVYKYSKNYFVSYVWITNIQVQTSAWEMQHRVKNLKNQKTYFLPRTEVQTSAWEI